MAQGTAQDEVQRRTTETQAALQKLLAINTALGWKQLLLRQTTEAVLALLRPSCCTVIAVHGTLIRQKTLKLPIPPSILSNLLLAHRGIVDVPVATPARPPVKQPKPSLNLSGHYHIDGYSDHTDSDASYEDTD
jgi:hypothetical protein